MGAHLGNYPQALTHADLVQAALAFATSGPSPHAGAAIGANNELSQR
ncbi:MAG: hypothetical protein ACXVXP_03095 [Mycobacteriaceae bacterium]